MSKVAKKQCDFANNDGKTQLYNDCTICDPVAATDQLASLILPNWGSWFAKEFKLAADGPPVYSSENPDLLSALGTVILQIGFRTGLSSAWLGRVDSQGKTDVQTSGLIEKDFLSRYVYDPITKALVLWRKPIADAAPIAQYLNTGMIDSEKVKEYRMDQFSAEIISKYNFAFRLVTVNKYGATQLQVALLNEKSTSHVRAMMNPQILNKILFKYAFGATPVPDAYFNVDIPFMWGPLLQKWISTNAIDRCCIEDFGALDYSVEPWRMASDVVDQSMYNGTAPNMYSTMQQACKDANWLTGSTKCDAYMQDVYCKRGAPTANDVQCACINVTDVSPESLRLFNVPAQTPCLSCRCLNRAAYRTNAFSKQPCNFSVCVQSVNGGSIASYIETTQTQVCNGDATTISSKCKNGMQCSKLGTCNEVTGECDCDTSKNVYGPTCAYVQRNCTTSESCGKYGVCTNGLCVCSAGYTGTLCDIPLGKFDPNNPFPTSDQRAQWGAEQDAAKAQGIAVLCMWVLGAILVLAGAIYWGLQPAKKAGPAIFGVGFVVFLVALVWYFLGKVILPGTNSVAI